jgi:hypothetical protein
MRLLTIKQLIVAIGLVGLLASCGSDPEYVPADEREQQQGCGTSDEDRNDGEDNQGGQSGSDDGTQNGGGQSGAGDDGSEVNGHQFVDLGLSVNWAIANIGSNEKPTSPGSLFKFGAISPVSSLDTPVSYPNLNGREYIAGTEFDAATAIYGSPWRMPTKAEIDELLSACRVTWSIKYGYEIVAANGNSIFLPSAGYCDLNYSGEYNYINNSESTMGCYWSASASGESAYALDFDGASRIAVNLVPRYRACSIRPVCPK